MPTKFISAASLWTLIMVAAKHRRRERVDRTPTGPPTGTSPGTLRAFTYKGAMGLNPETMRRAAEFVAAAVFR